MFDKIYLILRTTTMILCMGFFVLFFVPELTYAGSLDFNPDSSTIAVDVTTTVKVDIDAGPDQIAGTDIYITYNDDLLDLQSVTGGGYFPLVSNIPSTGKLYISGVVANQGEYKTGTGTVATLVFKGVNAGSTDLKFDCDLSKTSTSKVVKNDINASNVIDCSILKLHAVTVGVGSSSSSSSGTSSGTQASSLPESGVYDSLVKYSAIGGVLLFVGLAARILLHF